MTTEGSAEVSAGEADHEIEGFRWIEVDCCVSCYEPVVHVDGRWVHAAAERTRLEARLAEVEAERDGAYRERAQMVVALAKVFPSWVNTDPAEPDWPVLYVQFPTGQASWHFSPADRALLDGITVGGPAWDGHTTEEKYERIAAIEDPAAALRAAVRPLVEAARAAFAMSVDADEWCDACMTPDGDHNEPCWAAVMAAALADPAIAALLDQQKEQG